MALYSEKIEALIDAALADGVLTEKEKQVLFKKAQAEGIDLDEFEMVLDARLVEQQKLSKKEHEKAAPKSDKFGDVRKCPACGALVPAFKGVCSECGYEFSGVDAVLSSKQLAEEIKKASYDKEKAEIIETFPLPNTKADLLEFLTALKPRIMGTDFLSNAYFKKYSECIEKAKVSFPTDKMIQPFIAEFPSIANKRKWNSRLTWCKTHRWLLIGAVIGAVILLSIVVDGIQSSIQNQSIEKTLTLVENASKANDSSLLLNEMHTVSKDYSNMDEASRKKVILALVNLGELDEAIKLYESTSHGSYGSKTSSAEDCEAEFRKVFLERGDFDAVWKYYPLEYSGRPNYAGNARSYFNFCSDVIRKLCEDGKKNEARQFVKTHIAWFETNVDNGESSEKYQEYKAAKAKSRLLDYINKY